MINVNEIYSMKILEGLIKKITKVKFLFYALVIHSIELAKQICICILNAIKLIMQYFHNCCTNINTVQKLKVMFLKFESDRIFLIISSFLTP